MRHGVMHGDTEVRVQTGAPAWLRHVSIAVGYCAATSLFRESLIPHWLILCGFHVSALLLIRYKYWPALFAGEIISLAFLSAHRASLFGMSWAVLNLIPSLLFIAPVVYIARQRLYLLSGENGVNIRILLLSALAVACLVTLNSLALLLSMNIPLGYGDIHYGVVLSQWMIGNYLGVLTIAPTVLVFKQVFAGSNWNNFISIIVNSRLIFECFFILLPLLGFLIWIGLIASGNGQVREIMQIGMFLPVVCLAFRHGWHGAAIGGTAASLAIMILMPKLYDQNTLQAEVFIAFVISTMLFVGARMSTLNWRAQADRSDMRLVLELAQRNVQMGEAQLQLISHSLNKVRETVKSLNGAMMGHLKALSPVIDESNYQRDALIAQDQLYWLAESLYPMILSDHGLQAALREGPVPRILDEAGINYWCDSRGAFESISPVLYLTIYRLICETVANVCVQRNATEVGVRVRCGERAGRRWVALSLIFRVQPSRLSHVDWDDFLPRVKRTGIGLGMEIVRDRVATFEGKVRERISTNERRIFMMLFDPEGYQ